MYINGWTRESVMKQIRLKNLGKLSYKFNKGCRYRNDDGNQCLMGCFIPDAKYRSNMENLNISRCVNEFDLSSDMPLRNLYLNMMQNFHDYKLTSLEGEEFFKAIENKLIELEKTVSA